jgi:hypothetical protein
MEVFRQFQPPGRNRTCDHRFRTPTTTSWAFISHVERCCWLPWWTCAARVKNNPGDTTPFADPQEVLPLAKVAFEAETLCNLKARDDIALSRLVAFVWALAD